MADSAEEMRHHIKLYFMVYLALLALTVVTVGVSYLHLSTPAAVAVGMAVALVKGSLVAAIFMHLNNEKKIIYWSLYLTVFFFVVLILIPVLQDVEMASYFSRFY